MGYYEFVLSNESYNGNLTDKLRDAVAMALVSAHGRQLVDPGRIKVVNAVIQDYEDGEVLKGKQIARVSADTFKIQYDGLNSNIGEFRLMPGGGNKVTALLTLFGTWPVTTLEIEVAIKEQVERKLLSVLQGK